MIGPREWVDFLRDRDKCLVNADRFRMRYVKIKP